VEVDPLDEPVSKTPIHHQAVLAWYSRYYPTSERYREVVISRAFFLFFPCNHIINIKKKSFSGEAKDSAIFPFFILLHKRAKPIHPPYFLPPPTYPPIPPPSPSAHLSAHTFTLRPW
jgi:hypothetical protein